MRVSADRNDPDYRSDYGLISVFLDGKELTKCITADTASGTALVYATDAEGKIAPNRNGEPQVTTLNGVVEIGMP